MAGGDDCDRDAGQRRILPVFLEKSVAVHDRHHQIQQDDRGRILQTTEEPQRLPPIRRAHDLKAAIRQQVRERFSDIEIVVDDEDGTFRGPHRSFSDFDPPLSQ